MSGLTDAQEQTIQQKLLAAAREMPGVQSAALANGLPASSWTWSTDVQANGKRLYAGKHHTTPGYFETLEVPVLKGRDFALTDRRGASNVAIVNQTLARQMWGREDVLGEPISLVSEVGSKPAHVIGVVKDVLHGDPFADVRPWIYIPLSQHHEGWVELHVNTAGRIPEAKTALLNLINTLQPDLPYTEVTTVRESARDMFINQRVLAWNSAGFGLMALFMAMFGIYGVVSYSVAQRTHEYGVRVALGARSRDIALLVLHQAMVLVCIALPVGIAVAAAGAKIVSGFLVGVSTGDPVSFALVVALIVAVTFLAAYVPARRAVRIDPVEALRYE
jgi:predicted permease